jgi:hypothetical protein
LVRDLAVVYASLLNGLHSSGASYFVVGNCVRSADDAGSSTFILPRLREGVAAERNHTVGDETPLLSALSPIHSEAQQLLRFFKGLFFCSLLLVQSKYNAPNLIEFAKFWIFDFGTSFGRVISTQIPGF